jgi:hypothetical protein
MIMNFLENFQNDFLSSSKLSQKNSLYILQYTNTNQHNHSRLLYLKASLGLFQPNKLKKILSTLNSF